MLNDSGKSRSAPGVAAIPPSFADISRQKGKRERTRAALLDATAKLVAEHQADEISIGDITIAAGVANGTFYNYFKTKAEIIAETAFRITDEIGGLIHDPELAREDPVTMIVLGARQMIDLSVGHPTWAWALVKSAAYLPSVRAHISRHMAETLRLGIRQGVFKAKHDDFTLHLLLSMTFAAIHERLMDRAGAEAGSRLAEMHLRTLGLSPEAAAAAAYKKLKSPALKPEALSPGPADRTHSGAA